MSASTRCKRLNEALHLKRKRVRFKFAGRHRAVSKMDGKVEGLVMNAVVLGVVRDGRIVPDSPLPEGVRVEVRLVASPPEVPADLLAEFEAWGRASDRALALAEGQADAAR